MTHLAVRMEASSEEQDDEAMRQSLHAKGVKVQSVEEQQQQQQHLYTLEGKIRFTYMSHSRYHQKNNAIFEGGYYRRFTNILF